MGQVTRWLASFLLPITLTSLPLHTVTRRTWASPPFEEGVSLHTEEPFLASRRRLLLIKEGISSYA